MSNLNSTDLYERKLLERGIMNAYIMVAGGIMMSVGSVLLYFALLPTGTRAIFHGAFFGGFMVIGKGGRDLIAAKAALQQFEHEHAVSRNGGRSEA